MEEWGQFLLEEFDTVQFRPFNAINIVSHPLYSVTYVKLKYPTLTSDLMPMNLMVLVLTVSRKTLPRPVLTFFRGPHVQKVLRIQNIWNYDWKTTSSSTRNICFKWRGVPEWRSAAQESLILPVWARRGLSVKIHLRTGVFSVRGEPWGGGRRGGAVGRSCIFGFSHG